jgi:SAM-dependent methyltransferase
MPTTGANPERERWNRRFAEGSNVSEFPDTFFIDAYQDYVNPLLGEAGGRLALDVASGAGRHGLWLAERAWRVTLADIASQAFELAHRRAAGRNLAVEFLECDLSTVHSAHEAGWASRFDLILVFFYLQRDLFPVLVDALTPGGLLIFKTYTTLQRRFGAGPTNPAHLLEPGELRQAFPALSLLYYRETVRDSGVAELVARK